MIQAETITNAIAKIILEDSDIQAFCQSKFGKILTGEDNLIVIDSLVTAEKPTFTVVKLPEQHNFNEGTNDGYKSQWKILVSFFGEFGTIQEDDASFSIPTGTKVDVNGVTTYTPSDTMRIIARKSADAIYKKIGCSVQGVLLRTANIDAEDYYDAVSGEVKSYLQLDLYEKSTMYN